MHRGPRVDRAVRRSLTLGGRRYVAATLLAGTAAVLAASTKAAAQDYTYLLLVDYGPGETSVHPGNPSATVRVWATLKSSDYAWGNGDFDLTASEAGWTDFDLVLGVHGLFGHTRGTLSADRQTVAGVLTGQFNSLTGPPPKTDHPVLIWEGTWANMSGDYSPRSIRLESSNTSRYRVFKTATITTVDEIASFVPGAAQVTITPSPSALALLALISASAGARRRRLRAS